MASQVHCFWEMVLSQRIGPLLGHVERRELTALEALERIRYQYPLGDYQAEKIERKLEMLARSEIGLSQCITCLSWIIKPDS